MKPLRLTQIQTGGLADVVGRTSVSMTFHPGHSWFSVQVFKQLARTYADAHATMSNNDTERCGASFYRTRGIINGALWYSFVGGEMKKKKKVL